LDKLLYVDLPTPEERGEIMRTLIRTVRIGSNSHAVPRASTTHERDEAVAAIARLAIDRCDGYSGADLAALVREAAVGALRNVLLAAPPQKEHSSAESSARIEVVLDDFVSALRELGPSVSAVQRKRYEALRVKFAGGRGGGEIRVREDEGRSAEVGVGVGVGGDAGGRLPKGETPTNG
jgi:ribosome biogenesis ATPase